MAKQDRAAPRGETGRAPRGSSAPMAQQRPDFGGASLPQSFVQLVGCREQRCVRQPKAEGRSKLRQSAS